MKHGHRERPWQEGHTSGGQLESIKEVASSSGEYKAVISRSADQALRVCVYRHFYDDAVDECYWLEVSEPSLADSIETADKLAFEELSRVP